MSWWVPELVKRTERGDEVGAFPRLMTRQVVMRLQSSGDGWAARPGVVPTDGLTFDLGLGPGDGLQLSPGEHRGLVAMEGRVGPLTLAVCEHRVRARLIPELDRKDPPVATHRLALP